MVHLFIFCLTLTYRTVFVYTVLLGSTPSSSILYFDDLNRALSVHVYDILRHISCINYCPALGWYECKAGYTLIANYTKTIANCEKWIVHSGVFCITFFVFRAPFSLFAFRTGVGIHAKSQRILEWLVQVRHSSDWHATWLLLQNTLLFSPVVLKDFLHFLLLRGG